MTSWRELAVSARVGELSSRVLSIEKIEEPDATRLRIIHAFRGMPGGKALQYAASLFPLPKQRLTMSDLDPKLHPEERWNTGIAVIVGEDDCVETGHHIDEVTEWARMQSRGRVFRSVITRDGQTMAYKFRFDLDADKAMFKLRWS
jgi:hypothetical protein